MKRLVLLLAVVCFSGCAPEHYELSRTSTRSSSTNPPEIIVYTPPSVPYIQLYQAGEEDGEPAAPSYRIIDPNVDYGAYKQRKVNESDRYTPLKPVTPGEFEDQTGDEGMAENGENRKKQNVNKVELINIETGKPMSSSYKLQLP